MWLLRIKNLSKTEVFDVFEDGVEYEQVGSEIHIQYCLKKYLLDDLKCAKERSLRHIDYEIEKLCTVPLVK